MTSFYLHKGISNAMIEQTPAIDNQGCNFLKFLFLPLLSIAIAAIYLYLSKKVSVYRLIQGTLSWSIAFFSLFFLLLIPNAGYLQDLVNWNANSPFKGIIDNWITSSFYLVASIWPVITVLLFYGYTNERYSFKEAAKLYPFLGIATLLLSYIAMPWIFAEALPPLNIDHSFLLGFVSLGQIALVKTCYYLLKRSEGKPKEETTLVFTWKYILSLGTLALSIGLVKNLIILIWDSNFNLQNPYDENYWKYLVNFPSLNALAILLAVIIMVFLSFFLQQHLAKGWRNFCYGGTFITLFIALTLISLNVMDGVFEFLFSSAYSNFSYHVAVKVGVSYQILISTVLFPALICLKELALVPICKNQRFRTKIFVDLIFWKMGYFLAVALQEAFWSMRGITTPIMIFIAIAFLITISIRLALIRYVGNTLELAIAPDR